MIRLLAKYFLQGLAYTVPTAVTIYVLYKIFVVTDELIPMEFPGLGILVLLAVVTSVGVVGSFLISLPLFSFLENLLHKTPLIKIIYTSVKDLVDAFVGQKKSFNRPVIVKLYENSAIKRVGFLTNEGWEALMEPEDKTLITVYLPHSFAISGQLFLVPPHYITPLHVKPAEVMKYVVAGGVVREEPAETNGTA
jgi:uncharacterized membrane protein